MTVPFVALKAQYHSIKSEIDEAAIRVFESSQFVLGPEVASFEKDFAVYCGVEQAIGVNSGTSALHLALLASGVGPGDEVITIPFTFVATVAAVGYTGAKAVFVDIDPKSFTMDPSKIEAAITPKTKVIMPVHLYGQCADMDPILSIAKKHKLVVIEDAAQAHGVEYKGKKAGSMGDLGCFSFYPGKNLGAYGEGGMVTTNNPEYTRTIRMLRDWGAEKKYQHVLKGFNFRLEGIQGAILKVKLKYLEKWSESRRSHAALYTKLLVGSAVTTPDVMPYGKPVFHVYAVRTPAREDLMAFLTAEGIQHGIHYPIPVHLLPAHADLGYKVGDFPNSEKAANEVLSLPMFAELTDEQIKAVCDAIQKWSKK